jgi:hypothetical protein
VYGEKAFTLAAFIPNAKFKSQIRSYSAQSISLALNFWLTIRPLKTNNHIPGSYCSNLSTIQRLTKALLQFYGDSFSENENRSKIGTFMKQIEKNRKTYKQKLTWIGWKENGTWNKGWWILVTGRCECKKW